MDPTPSQAAPSWGACLRYTCSQYLNTSINPLLCWYPQRLAVTILVDPFDCSKSGDHGGQTRSTTTKTLTNFAGFFARFNHLKGCFWIPQTLTSTLSQHGLVQNGTADNNNEFDDSCSQPWPGIVLIAAGPTYFACVTHSPRGWGQIFSEPKRSLPFWISSSYFGASSCS